MNQESAPGHKAPSHLRAATRRWWLSVAEEWGLEEHHLRLLTLACEAWDVAQRAREDLRRMGSLTFFDRFRQPKARPEVGMQRDAMILFARLLRELDLDTEGPAEAPRPPGLRSNGG